ncbi:MAG: hypothetical protein ACT4NL_00485 [Pseudomarimonas sp.]
MNPMLTTYSFNVRRSRPLDRVAPAGAPPTEEFNVILVLEQRHESNGNPPNEPRCEQHPVAPLLLSPEPALRKCSPRACLRRLGVYVPLRTRGLRLGAAVPISAINPNSSPP